jgi:hypothetical protein
MAVAGAMAVVGCGGDDGNGCGRVSPCGGDAVGSWSPVATCEKTPKMGAAASFTIRAMNTTCPIQSLHNVQEAVSGSLLLGSDATYALSTDLSGSVDVLVPASCLSSSSCAMVSANLQAEIAAGLHPSVVSGSCSGSPDCVCHEVFSLPQAEQGTYATSGNFLTFAATDGTTTTSQYCVRGNTLHLVNLGEPTVGTVDTDLVAVKQ